MRLFWCSWRKEHHLPLRKGHHLPLPGTSAIFVCARPVAVSIGNELPALVSAHRCSRTETAHTCASCGTFIACVRSRNSGKLVCGCFVRLELTNPAQHACRKLLKGLRRRYLSLFKPPVLVRLSVCLSFCRQLVCLLACLSILCLRRQHMCLHVFLSTTREPISVSIDTTYAYLCFCGRRRDLAETSRTGHSGSDGSGAADRMNRYGQFFQVRLVLLRRARGSKVVMALTWWRCLLVLRVLGGVGWGSCSLATSVIVWSLVVTPMFPLVRSAE